MKHPKFPLRPLAFALLCAFASAAAAIPQGGALASASEPAKTLYREGHDAIERKDWSEAVDRFRALERSQRDAKESTDAALYWHAYALSQARRSGEAQAIVERLLKAYPDSTWADDARSLVASGRRGAVVADGNDESREEDALMALDALLASGSKRAVPMLQKVLASNHGDKVKSRAMFVLSQYDAQAADAALATILGGNSSTGLKQEAIRMIAAGGRRDSLDRLLPLFRDGTDPKIRQAVIDAWIIGGRGDLLRQAAASENDPRMRKRAIHAMGAVGDRKGLLELFAQVKDEEGQRDVLEGLGIAGGRSELETIARGNAAVEVRAAAVRSLGIAGGKNAADTIASMYAGADENIRRAVIEGLIIGGGSKQLVSLYRQESDRRYKRKLLEAISATGGDEALDVIDEILDK